MTTREGLPPDLRGRVLAAALHARSAGRPIPVGPSISAADAFGRAADAFSALLAALDDEQWRRPALRGLDVQGLVGHLTGVEQDVHRALADDPAVAGADHVVSTQGAADAEAGRSPEETRRAWRSAVEGTARRVAADDPARVVAVHGMRLPLAALLVVRAFELWTHENDIRAATGLPPSEPDTPVLALMTDLAVGSLPVGMARIGADPVPLDLHLVLTGPGGGTWDVALGEDTSPGREAAEVMVVADASRFCRLVAHRIEPAALGAHVRGEAADVGLVLRAAAALALD
jgi:uncharacterized protein (TIGR03083 family)